MLFSSFGNKYCIGKIELGGFVNKCFGKPLNIYSFHY